MAAVTYETQSLNLPNGRTVFLGEPWGRAYWYQLDTLRAIRLIGTSDVRAGLLSMDLWLGNPLYGTFSSSKSNGHNIVLIRRQTPKLVIPSKLFRLGTFCLPGTVVVVGSSAQSPSTPMRPYMPRVQCSQHCSNHISFPAPASSSFDQAVGFWVLFDQPHLSTPSAVLRMTVRKFRNTAIFGNHLPIFLEQGYIIFLRSI